MNPCLPPNKSVLTSSLIMCVEPSDRIHPSLIVLVLPNAMGWISIVCQVSLGCWLKAIERKFFHYLCDYMLEDVKMLRMSEKELCKRMTYENKETYLRMIDECQSLFRSDSPDLYPRTR